MTEIHLSYISRLDRAPKLPYILDTDPEGNKDSAVRAEGYGRTDYRDGTIWYAREIGDPHSSEHFIEVIGFSGWAFNRVEISLKVGESARVKLRVSSDEYELKHLSIPEQ